MLSFYFRHNGKIRSLVTFSYIGSALFFNDYFFLKSSLFLTTRFLIEYFFIKSSKIAQESGKLHIFYTGKTRLVQIAIGYILTALITSVTVYFNLNFYKAELIFLVLLINRGIELVNPFSWWSTMVYEKKIYKNNYLLVSNTFSCCPKIREIDFNTFEISDEKKKLIVNIDKRDLERFKSVCC